MQKLFIILCLLCVTKVSVAAEHDIGYLKTLIQEHPEQTGVYVLDIGKNALIARAWLADNAQHSIDVQYFIWSSDNIGTLASEALLRAANRGVTVRVIVDDLLIDAPDKTLLALAKHPNINIKIYNPKHSVGIPWYKRLWHVVTDFKGVNQRMHDKTFIVDGSIAITGGRNMADEYFDYDHTYNFRDRDVLLLGQSVNAMNTSFQRFWSNPLAVTVEHLYSGKSMLSKAVTINNKAIENIYAGLNAYAASTDHYSSITRKKIESISEEFATLSKEIIWIQAVEFISDIPGKNNRPTLTGGGQTTTKLGNMIKHAQQSIIVQSPYLVMSDKAKALFKAAVDRGVKVKINTNSMASTDNIQAFSGYRNQRKQLLDMGIQIYEHMPLPINQKSIMAIQDSHAEQLPVFAIHAKTMVIDQRHVYIGTFNFDPRSENLNTEVGVIADHPTLAQLVSQSIETDMATGNSWNTATDDPDQYADWWKCTRVFFWQLMPIKPLL